MTYSLYLVPPPSLTQPFGGHLKRLQSLAVTRKAEFTARALLVGSSPACFPNALPSWPAAGNVCRSRDRALRRVYSHQEGRRLRWFFSLEIIVSLSGERSSTCKVLSLFSSPKAITKDMFEEALRALADDDFLTVTGKTVRLL